MGKPHNTVQLIGHLGDDPKVKFIDEENLVLNFNLATDDGYKSGGEKVKNTNWHKIVCWSPLSDIFQNSLKKGSKILVTGRIQNNNYEDKEGNKVYSYEIIAEYITSFNNKED